MGFTRSFAKDYKFGKSEEVKSLPLLNSFFKTNLIHIENPKAPFDFENDIFAIEQKARTCTSSCYPTTLIDYNKIENCSLPQYKLKECWLIFAFTDGLYGIQYSEQKFAPYERRSEQFRDRIDKKAPLKLRIYIPIEDLTQLNIS